jgi:heat shock protein HslJ
MTVMLTKRIFIGVSSLISTTIMLMASFATTAGGYQEFAGSGLEGAEWVVVSITGTKIVADSDSTLTFGDNGKVHGSAGCNNFSGGGTLDGDQITFTQLATTRKMCALAIMDAEQGFLVALEQTRSFTVDEEFLRFLDADGNELVRFHQLSSDR